jgi:hypothetical protein
VNKTQTLDIVQDLVAIHHRAGHMAEAVQQAAGARGGLTRRAVAALAQDVLELSVSCGAILLKLSLSSAAASPQAPAEAPTATDRADSAPEAAQEARKRAPRARKHLRVVEGGYDVPEPPETEEDP